MFSHVSLTKIRMPENSQCGCGHQKGQVPSILIWEGGVKTAMSPWQGHLTLLTKGFKVSISSNPQVPTRELT